MNLQDLKQQRKAALDKCDAILSVAENAGRPLNASENANLTAAQQEVESFNVKIRQLESQNTILQLRPQDLMSGGNHEARGPRSDFRKQQKELSPQYASAFYEMVRNAGKGPSNPALAEGFDPQGGGFALPGFLPRNARVNAALYEGTDSAGGYAVPITVDDQIVPLAPQEMAVRQVSTVIPTSMDIKMPTKQSFSTASAKAETTSFTESEPTLGQFTLSAYMAGVLQEISWELAQDVPAFQAFAVDDMILAQQMYEENLYVNGTGSGQAQGLIGNVGTGYGPQEPDTNGNLISITGLLNLMGTLNAVYQRNASWLMSRPASIVIRKAQVESNLFFPAFQRDPDGTDRLFGFPVFYSAYVPTVARGNTPVLFGDFKRGYIIGDRGGSGINVKVLDQPLASQGLLQLLAYRRTDGRVRRSEAIQSYTVSAS
jgi:HK97 family phage major capsid protein